ncbi:MAG: DUF2779 domain-containing protein, partial [Patescibacteria group bacterium]
MITKSDYIKYLQCKKALWLKKNRSELMVGVGDNTQRVFDTGFLVERIAYEMFPSGVETAEDIGESIKETKELLKQKTPVIFQATVSGHDLFCRSDIAIYDSEGDVWDIVEVKSSSHVKDVHIDDLAFQKVCFEKNGYKVGKLSVIHVNNEYVKDGDIVAQEFLTRTDVTEEVEEKLEYTKTHIQNALKLSKAEKEPEVRILRQCSEPYNCPFIDYCWKDFSQYSIYAIGGALGEKNIEKLLDMGIEKVADIPEGFLSGEKLVSYYNALKNDEVHIDKENIQKELSQIEYPIYYLDYETYSPTIPLLDGYRPFQRIVFQYSLHIQESPNAELKHYEFLARDLKDPTTELAKSLQEQIGDTGVIIAWNIGFEKGCNNEMGQREPEFKEFFENINERMYDLMNVFKKRYYVHKDFATSASIKKVLPVIVPELDYGILDISEGMTASNNWGDMVTKD